MRETVRERFIHSGWGFLDHSGVRGAVEDTNGGRLRGIERFVNGRCNFRALDEGVVQFFLFSFVLAFSLQSSLSFCRRWRIGECAFRSRGKQPNSVLNSLSTQVLRCWTLGLVIVWKMEDISGMILLTQSTGRFEGSV